MDDLQSALIRRLAACERGLAAAYLDHVRAAHPLPIATRAALRARAAAHIAHAAALATRANRFDPLSDDLWITGRAGDPRTLAIAERAANSTLHDALSDFDAPTRALLLRLIADHEPFAAPPEDDLPNVV